MSDLSRIHALIAATRRRLRTQTFLEWLVTALPLAVAGALAVLWFWRMDLLADGPAIGLAVGLGVAALAVALFGATRPIPRAKVASRLDRASGLADRLGTACEFDERLKSETTEHPETVALMQAAIDDAAAHADKADPRAAAPFKAPRDTRAAAAFLVIAGAVASLGFARERKLLSDYWPKITDQTAAQKAAAELRDKQALDPDDMAYARQYVEELKAIADQTKDPVLQELSDKLAELLDKAERGDISKEELLAKMEALEKQYDEQTQSDPSSDLDELKDAAKELKKEPLTKRLGEALEQGDMDAAAKEMERLAEQMDKNELTPEQQQRLAKALDEAAKKQEEAKDKKDQKQQKEDQKKDEELAKKKDEVRKLQKKSEEHPEDQQAKRELDKKKRELEKLERDKQDRDQQAQNKQERKLDRMGRDMKQAAENLKNKKSQEAKNDMQDGAKQAKGFEQEHKQAQNKKQTQSQLADLKQALRNAKQRQGDGKGGRTLSRLGRQKEWEQRAGGQQPGQQPGQKPGEGPDGQGPPGPGHGDTPSPEDLMGAKTHPKGPTRDENLSGVDGRGPSKRQTIITAAQKGFSGQAYKQVYADYKKVVEEVIRQEKIPPAYRYVVKKYIDRVIRPRQD